MSYLANSLFTSLFAWLRALIQSLWQQIQAGHFHQLLRWLGQWWWVVTIVLCIAFTCVDIGIQLKKQSDEKKEKAMRRSRSQQKHPLVSTSRSPEAPQWEQRFKTTSVPYGAEHPPRRRSANAGYSLPPFELPPTADPAAGYRFHQSSGNE